MVAAVVLRCEHLPNGGIQCLRVKPMMCLIGQCAPRCTRIRMVIKIVVNLPAFFVALISLLVTTIS